MSKRFYALAAAALAASTSTAALAASDMSTSTEADTEINATTDADLDTGANGLEGTGTATASSDTEMETEIESESLNVTGSSYASTGEMAEFKTYGDVISELKKARKDGFDLSALDAEADAEVTVETITLSDLKGNAAMEARALEKEVNEQADALQELRDRLSAHADAQAALEAEGEGYSAEDVVAYRVGADGRIILVIDDRG